MDALGIQHLLWFLLAGWALNLTPGPDVLTMVAHSLNGGARAGMVAMAGVCAGCLVHVAAATLGVGALVAASGAAFTVLKWLGAAYLVYSGLMMWTASFKSKTPKNIANKGLSTLAPSGFVSDLRLQAVFWQGFWTNALNPKVALFFLAFLPQFIAPSAHHPQLAFLVLGLLFIVASLPINIGYVLLAAWVRGRTTVQQRTHTAARWLERATGAAFVGFGVRLAATELPR